MGYTPNASSSDITEDLGFTIEVSDDLGGTTSKSLILFVIQSMKQQPLRDKVLKLQK